MLDRMDTVRRLCLLALVVILAAACTVPAAVGSDGLEVGSTTLPGSPRPPQPTPSGTPEPLATTLPAGSYRVPAGGAGVVTIRLTDSGVLLEGIEPATGWLQQPAETEDGRVEVQLVGPGGTRMWFRAEQESDGSLSTRIRETAAIATGQRTITSGDAGSVTFTHQGDRLRVDDARANNAAGWHVVGDDIDDDGFVIALANSGRSTGIRISVDLDSEDRIEMETRTRIGPGYRSGLREEEPTRTATPRPPARPTPTDEDDEDGRDGDDEDDEPDTVDTIDTVDTRDTTGTRETLSPAD